MTNDELNRKLRSNQWIEGTNRNWYKNGVKIYANERSIDIVSKDGDRNIDISDMSYGEIMDAINKWRKEIIDKVINVLEEDELALVDGPAILKDEISIYFFGYSIGVAIDPFSYSCSYSDVYFTEDEVHLGDLTINIKEWKEKLR